MSKRQDKRARREARRKAVEAAAAKLNNLLCDLEDQHGLTIAETITILSNQVTKFADVAVRLDRDADDAEDGTGAA